MEFLYQGGLGGGGGGGESPEGDARSPSPRTAGAHRHQHLRELRGRGANSSRRPGASSANPAHASLRTNIHRSRGPQTRQASSSRNIQKVSRLNAMLCFGFWVGFFSFLIILLLSRLIQPFFSQKRNMSTSISQPAREQASKDGPRSMVSIIKISSVLQCNFQNNNPAFVL